MKNLVAAPIAALLLSAGLVASAGTVAHADPYPGTVATTTKAKVPTSVLRGSNVSLCGKVKAVNSNATPTGDLYFEVDRIGGGSRIVTKTVAYPGGKVCITKNFRHAGSYVLKVSYSSAPNSVFNDSSGAKGFRVFTRGN